VKTPYMIKISIYGLVYMHKINCKWIKVSKIWKNIPERFPFLFYGLTEIVPGIICFFALNF